MLWEKHVRVRNMKTNYLVLLKEPFSLDMPYVDRQRMVVVSDEQVTAERSSRGCSGWALDMGIHSVSVPVRVVRGDFDEACRRVLI